MVIYSSPLDSLNLFLHFFYQMKISRIEDELKNNRESRLSIVEQLTGSSDFDIFLEIQYTSCFFWFSLEILRLVYKKKHFFRYFTGSLFDLNPPKQVALPLTRIEKKFPQNSPQRV